MVSCSTISYAASRRRKRPQANEAAACPLTEGAVFSGGAEGELRIADCRGTIEEHLRIGEGTVDFPAMFRAIESGGYRGHYMQGYTTLDDMLADRDLLVSQAAEAA